mmetsp:Transcript_22197/g.56813  ORF Transcript_22197/g.56813 Transcript_22197/m.56813 type:complete len:257 (+) Transcript_22197:668-1438(+)
MLRHTPPGGDPKSSQQPLLVLLPAARALGVRGCLQDQERAPEALEDSADTCSIAQAAQVHAHKVRSHGRGSREFRVQGGAVATEDGGDSQTFVSGQDPRAAAARIVFVPRCEAYAQRNGLGLREARQRGPRPEPKRERGSRSLRRCRRRWCGGPPLLGVVCRAAGPLQRQGHDRSPLRLHALQPTGRGQGGQPGPATHRRPGLGAAVGRGGRRRDQAEAARNLPDRRRRCTHPDEALQRCCSRAGPGRREACGDAR